MSLSKRFSEYKPTQASSFWLDRDFDSNWTNTNTNTLDITKLAAAQRAIANFVNIVTGKTIPVKFQSNDSSFTDGTTVTIGTKLDGKNFDPAVGLALHEGSHIAHTDFSLFKGANGKSTSNISETLFAKLIRYQGLDPNLDLPIREFKIIKDLLNWVEDRRIDYKIYTTAPGYRMYYESMYDKFFNDKIIDKALLSGAKNQETIDDYMFHIINFTNSNRKLNTLKHLRLIWNIIDLKNIQRLNSTQDALIVACDIFKILKQVINNNTAESEDKSNESDAGDEDGEENESTQEESSESNSEPQLSSQDTEKLKKAILKQQDFLDGYPIKKGKLSSKIAKTVDALKEAGCETREVSTSITGASDFVETIVIKKLTPGIISSMPELFGTNSDDYVTGQRNYDNDVRDHKYSAVRLNNKQEAVNAGIVLGKQLGRKLQLRNSDRSLKSTRLQTGKIDKRLISQLGYNNINVFHRIVTDRFKNYFIHISIDASGSMSGDKFANALTSAIAVAQAAAMTTGIRVQISLRGTYYLNNSRVERSVTIYAYDSAVDKIHKIKNMFKYLDVFGCTPEGIAFKSIEKDILKDAKGDECIFVNYSDGGPTDISGVARSYDGVAYTKNAINCFRSYGINIISYFICSLYGSDYEQRQFKTMYGPDACFIKPTNMIDVSKTLNQKFLEIAK
jgi:hypothetical protein